MFTAMQCESGEHAGKWFTVAVQPGGLTHRIGYCAHGCPGHESGARVRGCRTQAPSAVSAGPGGRPVAGTAARAPVRDLRRSYHASGAPGARHQAPRPVHRPSVLSQPRAALSATYRARQLEAPTTAATVAWRCVRDGPDALEGAPGRPRRPWQAGLNDRPPPPDDQVVGAARFPHATVSPLFAGEA
jgi:hypothetical protein